MLCLRRHTPCGCILFTWCICFKYTYFISNLRFFVCIVRFYSILRFLSPKDDSYDKCFIITAHERNDSISTDWKSNIYVMSTSNDPVRFYSNVFKLLNSLCMREYYRRPFFLSRFVFELRIEFSCSKTLLRDVCIHSQLYRWDFNNKRSQSRTKCLNTMQNDLAAILRWGRQRWEKYFRFFSNRMYADRNPPLPSKEERKKLTLRDLKDLLKSVHSESPPTWFHRSSPIELHDPRYSATVEHRWEGEELKPLTKRHSFASWAVISIWIPTRTELTVKSHRDKKISQQLKWI